MVDHTHRYSTRRIFSGSRSQQSAALRVLLVVIALLAIGSACEEQDIQRQRVLAHNSDDRALYSAAVIDSLLASEQELPTSRRIGLWARRFLADPESEYYFGLKEGGYVAEGLIVCDHRQDCVSFMYRCSELARARDHADAIELALATRFAGGDLDSLVDERGRLDYDRPEHLDYSLDMIRSGHWGRDVTADLDGLIADSLGTSRYPAGSFSYVPSSALDTSELREGDLAWLVLNPAHESARRLRDKHGIVIGHLGLLIEEEDEIHFVHAASSDLPGAYEGGRVVRVPLQLYLERVDRFCGVMITRF